MKRLSLAIMFVMCALALTAQDGIQVKFQGAQPTISDFLTAYLEPTYGEDGECDNEYMNGIRNAWERHRKGLKQLEGDSFTLDVRNGFAVYEYKYREGDSEFLTRFEMCFWNEADKKHKLIGCSRWSYENDRPSLGQYDGLTFLRYDNATKRMIYSEAPGFEVEYDNVTYSLPRTGKDLILNKWNANGQKTQKTLKWNGHGFDK